jgi:hypothetical protein
LRIAFIGLPLLALVIAGCRGPETRFIGSITKSGGVITDYGRVVSVERTGDFFQYRIDLVNQKGVRTTWLSHEGVPPGDSDELVQRIKSGKPWYFVEQEKSVPGDNQWNLIPTKSPDQLQSAQEIETEEPGMAILLKRCGSSDGILFDTK